MNQETLAAGRQEAISGFSIEGSFVSCKPCGHGHINDTYMIEFEQDGVICHYSLQHMEPGRFY